MFQKEAMEVRKEEPETINVWELMSGIDDGGEASPRSLAFPAIPARKQMPVSSDLPSKLSLDSFTLDPPLETPKRPQLSSLRNADQGHARDSVLALEDPVKHVQTSSEAANPASMPASNGSSLFGSVSGQSTSSTFEAAADNLQRSLSFKLVFNNQNKGILGLEQDSLFSNSSQDECSKNGLLDSASVQRSSEGDSLPESSPGLTSLFSTTSILKRLFGANKGTPKLQNSMRGGLTQDSNSKQLPAYSNALPPLSSIPSGNVTEMGPGKRVSGSSSRVSESGSSRRGSNDFSEVSGPSLHKTANMPQNKVMEVGHGHPVRRYRHSFSNGNQNRGSAEDDIPTTVNRPSSWELEKVVADSGFKAVLYSTNVRTDINAYEDSNAVRAILISLVGAAFDEKCVSQNPEYEQELKFALNLPVVAVPTVYIQGKYIAGIDNIMQFFKKGILGSLLLQTLPHGLKPNTNCICRGGKFLICPICKGKRRIIRQGEDPVSCRHCVGTGLLKCPSCPK